MTYYSIKYKTKWFKTYELKYRGEYGLEKTMETFEKNMKESKMKYRIINIDLILDYE